MTAFNYLHDALNKQQEETPNTITPVEEQNLQKQESAIAQRRQQITASMMQGANRK